MSAPNRDLPEESLASLDSFGNRLFIYPAQVKGFWHHRRRIFQTVLMLVFLVLPWVKINGHQALLLNIPNRQFAIFGLTFWAHDGPLVFFLLAILVMGLALITTLFGRVWCGWACPQTVFIEAVYRKIEQWCEGNHIQRRRLNEAPLSAEKAVRKSLKWILFIGVSLIISHSLLAYFVGTERLAEMTRHSPKENWTAFLVMVFVAGTVLFDFGWFREQFCIIMCPFGRFQSVLMDRHSLAIMYDQSRGEPRKGTARDSGDCINCYKCVAVCPTAVDIRRGVQMECIACTACADACDEVMSKIGKSTGLIRYSSERQMQGGTINWLRSRVLLYATLLVVSVLGLGIAVARRPPIHANLLRAVEAPYQIISTQKISNHFQLALRNNEFLTAVIHISGPHIIAPGFPLTLPAGQASRQHIFFQFPRTLTDSSGGSDIVLKIEATNANGTQVIETPVRLLGPTQTQ